ncbi:MAG: hypothetical protein ACXWL2_02465 [Candidatus Chromulinivorax sp.]
MFNNMKCMMIAGLFLVNISTYALQIVIPVQDFRAGNSLVLIARDMNGDETVAGCVEFAEGKTEFSQDEITADYPLLLSLSEQDSSVITVQQDRFEDRDGEFIYLYFDVDASMDIVRVLVVKNNFFADTPFDVLEFSTSNNLLADEDDEDDFFSIDTHTDELSQFNLEDIHAERVELSLYDKTALALCAFWAIHSVHAKKIYKNITKWFSSESHE